MTADPAALRALAARVETEEPTEELHKAVALACGWQTFTDADGVAWWRAPTGRFMHWAPYLTRILTDLTVAASLMPAGWWVTVTINPGCAEVDAGREAGGVLFCAEATAATEPRARVAAALRARAVDAEAEA